MQEKQYYSMTELLNKYSLKYAKGGNSANKEKYLSSIGIITQEVPSNFKRKKMYQIIDDSLFNLEWVKHPTKDLELTKDGQVRNATSKVIYSNYKNAYGYIQVANNFLHRLLMETFNPNPLPGYFQVDHINGIRTDNRLENLRWVTSLRNTQLMNEHQKQIREKLQILIQNKGYDYVLSLLEREINS